MEKIKEEQPFQTGDTMKDMMSYARKLNALGDVVMTMCWLQKAHNIGEPEFFRFGQELGNIIQDYAQGLQIMLDKADADFYDREKLFIPPLERLQEVYDFIVKTRRKEDLCAVNNSMQTINSFIESAAIPAFRLKNNFEALKKDILSENKSTPEAVAVAAGA